jgi:uncharacterized protein YlzI (FlbEa/FlbD family)
MNMLLEINMLYIRKIKKKLVFIELINGKCYIGSNSNLGIRLRIYFSKKQMHNKLKINKSLIYKALLKYGYDNFTL